MFTSEPPKDRIDVTCVKPGDAFILLVVLRWTLLVLVMQVDPSFVLVLVHSCHFTPAESFGTKNNLQNAFLYFLKGTRSTGCPRWTHNRVAGLPIQSWATQLPAMASFGVYRQCKNFLALLCYANVLICGVYKTFLLANTPKRAIAGSGVVQLWKGKPATRLCVHRGQPVHIVVPVIKIS